MIGWKPVDNFAGYSVNIFGEVAGPRGILKPCLVGRDRSYFRVILSVGGKKQSKYVHRLVAETFIKKIQGKNQVNHINGNKKDNRVENLEWCTPAENIQHAIRTGLLVRRGIKGNKFAAKVNKEIASKIKARCLLGITQKQVAKEFNISHQLVGRIKRNEVWV